MENLIIIIGGVFSVIEAFKRSPFWQPLREYLLRGGSERYVLFMRVLFFVLAVITINATGAWDDIVPADWLSFLGDLAEPVATVFVAAIATFGAELLHGGLEAAAAKRTSNNRHADDEALG